MNTFIDAISKDISGYKNVAGELLLTYEQKKADDYDFINKRILEINSYKDYDSNNKNTHELLVNYEIANGRSGSNIGRNSIKSDQFFKKNFKTQSNSQDSDSNNMAYFDIQRRILTRMWGENQKTTLKGIAFDFSGYNQNVRKKERLGLFQDYIQSTIIKPTSDQITQELLQQYQVQSPQELKPEQQQQMQAEVEKALKFKLPSDIDKYMRTSYKSPSEAQLQRLTDWALAEFNIKFISDECYKDLTIAGFEAIEQGIRNNIPYIETINPVLFDFYNPKSSPIIEDAEWWIREKELTYRELIGDYINTPELVKQFNEHVTKGSDQRSVISGEANDRVAQAISSFVNMPTEMIDPVTGNRTIPDIGTPEGQKFYETAHRLFGSRFNDKNLFTSKRTVFVSYDLLQCVYRENSQNRNKYDKFFVGENYKINKSIDKKVEQQWFPALYEGTEIGNFTGFILNKKRTPFQNRSINDPRKLYSPFIGVEFSKLHGNTRRISPLDLGKASNSEYNQLKKKVKELDDTNIGRIFMIPDQAIPDEYRTQDLLTFAKNNKFLPIDLTALGEAGFSQVAAQMFKSVDVSNDDYINNYMQRMAAIERECMEAMSYSPSSMGMAPASMTATSNQQNIIQGSYATEDIRSLHTMFQQRMLESFVNLVRNALRENDHLRTYLLDNLGIAELDLDEDTLNLSEYGVKIVNDSENLNDINSIKSLLQPMIQNQLIDFPDATKIQFSKEPSAIVNLAEESRERIQNQQEQSAKQAQANEAEKLKLAREQFEQMKVDKERDFQLRELQIRLSADQFRLQADADDNKVPDAVQTKLVDSETQLEVQKHEIASREKIEEMKNETELIKIGKKLEEAKLKVVANNKIKK